jgi:uncharacterized protein YegP (UPF0339 family)
MRRFEAYEDENGKWRWRLWSNGGKILASSGEAFPSQTGALQAAERVRAAANGAEMASAPGLGIRAALRLRALLSDGEQAPAAGATGGRATAGAAGGQAAATASGGREPATASGGRRPRLRAVKPLRLVVQSPSSLSVGTGS